MDQSEHSEPEATVEQRHAAGMVLKIIHTFIHVMRDYGKGPPTSNYEAVQVILSMMAPALAEGVEELIYKVWEAGPEEFEKVGMAYMVETQLEWTS